MREKTSPITIALLLCVAILCAPQVARANDSPPAPTDGTNTETSTGEVGTKSLTNDINIFTQIFQVVGNLFGGKRPTSSSSGSAGDFKALGDSSLLTVRGNEQEGLLRATPALQKAMTLRQSGQIDESIQVLQNAADEATQATQKNPGLVEGKQMASLRNIVMSMGNVSSSLQGSGGFGGIMGLHRNSTKNMVSTIAKGLGVDCDYATALGNTIALFDPLLLDMNGNGIADVTTPDVLGKSGGFVSKGSVWFDIAGQGRSVRTEWIKASQDGLLVLDANGNGVVDSSSELFGDMDGFVDGFAKLAVLDVNNDGVLTGKELSALSVWIDQNGDGICQAGDLQKVTDQGISCITVTSKNSISSFTRHGRVSTVWNWFPRSER